ncbi:MAG: FAD-dependent oxidoreductase [Sphingomonadales bacterium]|nr:FAD-dependent oxidoreductase [Sphingomonadales bacterium]
MAGFDETFDWVVVGSGAGSMASALIMRQAGKSVVILEKGQWVGGTTCKSGGVMWIPNNPFMAPGEDSTEKGITYLNAVVGDDSDAPGTSVARRTAYVSEAPRMVDFLVQQGIDLTRGSVFWPDYYDDLPGGCKTSRTVVARPFDRNELPREWRDKLRPGFVEAPILLDDGMKLQWFRKSWEARKIFLKTAVAVVLGKLTGKHWVTAGAALQGRMLQAALKAGTDIRVNSAVSELVVEDGKVTGVVTVRDGKPWRVGARLGVLVNAGGFSQNQPMRDKYQPGTNKEWSNGIETDTGDLHIEMERVGGVLAQMDEMVGFQMTKMPGWDTSYVKPGTQSVTAKPHAIQVDQAGKRYMNEGGSYELFCETMLKHPGGVPSFAILDSRFMAEYQVAGVAAKPARIAEWVKSGWLKQADTIEALAAQINVDAATLRATVDGWNALCAKGHDDDFQRGDRQYDNWLGDPFYDGANKTMGPIDKGPFYAFEVFPGDVGTYGGVVTDPSARVLKGDGTPIPGLYACGVSTASAMGRVYPGAGASVGPSMCFGWIAAKHAAGLSNQV